MDKKNAALAEMKKKTIAQIDAVVHNLPGVVIIRELPGLNVVYMSPRGLRSLGMSLAQLIDMGKEYNNKYFNDAELIDHMRRIFAMLRRNDPGESISFFQQVRSAPGEPYNWHMNSTKILLQDCDRKPALTITIAQPMDPQDALTHRLNRLLKDNDFFKANYVKFGTLTKRELEVLILMGNSKSAREVSELLFISLHTVESHRKNARRKLNIKSNYDMQEYIRAFDLLQ